MLVIKYLNKRLIQISCLIDFIIAYYQDVIQYKQTEMSLLVGYDRMFMYYTLIHLKWYRVSFF